jgi:ElaB/YqjD/DUF883 family membrane-anchored ribosome-binding protein
MSGAGETEFDAEVDEFADDLEALKSDIDDRVQRLKTGADEATREILSEIEDGIAALYDELAEQGSRAVSFVEETVEEHPWTSLVVGFGLGCLVARILFRRH